MNEHTITKVSANKHEAPNKWWTKKFDNFLILVLVEQASGGLKCDKSFKRATFSFTIMAVNTRFKTDFTLDNLENHYRTLKTQYAEIKKVRELSGAGWDDRMKTITLDHVIALTYIDVNWFMLQMVSYGCITYQCVNYFANWHIQLLDLSSTTPLKTTKGSWLFVVRIMRRARTQHLYSWSLVKNLAMKITTMIMWSPSC